MEALVESGRDVAALGKIPIRDMSVQDLFDALTDGYEWVYVDPLADGPAEKHVPALIGMLRDAVFGGMEHSGGAGGFQARLPISAGALDLFEAIDMEITETWAELFPGKIPNADRAERNLTSR